MIVELSPLQFGVPGGMELAVILLIAILLFGANRIPKLARSTGQALGEFQRGRTQVEQELQEMQSDVEDAAAEPVEADAPEPASSTPEPEAEPDADDDTDEEK